ncbi:hypothetical protein NEMBOFW57_009045 [Staphylotrichum longicolle]|uniref:Uncharacterized protein n=1 Tax=Staphylotrichum longicolle TaxID=669026 RepID=A0AAD4EWR0_9PEZI|nr:hypothetical protein NEMBOFW57_009045 [Staphylotrichum longicolle]
MALCDISAWAARTDFSKLCRLTLPCYTASTDTLADIAARGDLTSLNALCMLDIDAEGARAVRRLLASLNPHSLQSLRLDGHVDDALFDTILDRHGESVQHLSLRPYPDYFSFEDENNPPPPPPIVLTPDLCAQLREKCPNLEDVQLPVDRTLGDARECAVYRELGRLSRLRRLSLRLRYSVLPNEDTLDGSGEFSNTPEEIPRAYLSQAFANAAVDAGLARAIFDLISSTRGGGLQHLQLLPERKAGRYAPGVYDRLFQDLLRWFARSWSCERRSSGPDVVEIRELHSHGTVEAGTQWQYLAGKSRHYDGEEIYGEAFGDVWPQTTPRWWEDWKSIPLSQDDSRAVPPS